MAARTVVTTPVVAWMISLACAVAGCSGGSSDAPPLPPAGTLDASFGSAGKVLLPQGAGAVMAVDSTGAAYLGGTAIVRLDPAGQRVAGYGAGLTVPRFVSALALDSAGNLYAASSSAGQPFAITKLDTNGNRVAAFGNVGTALAGPFPLAGAESANDLLVDPAGGLWAVGTIRTNTTDVPSFDAIAIARLDTEGRPLAGFGVAGRQVLSLPGIRSVDALAAAVDMQGNLVVLGLIEGVAQRQLVIVKVTATGALLPGFGTQGVVVLDDCSVLIGPSDIAVDAADNIYVASDCSPAGPVLRTVATLFKRDRNGAAVASFGIAGRRNDVFAAGSVDSSMATSLALDAANGIYVGGARGTSNPVCGDFAVARLDASGAPVAAFGQGGVAVFDMGGGDRVTVLALRGSGLYASGVSSTPCFNPGGATAMMLRLVP